MNYKKIYDSIISNRQLNPYEGYVEKHHIIPRSLGGSDDSDNVVALTAREHFVCHCLLAKMYPKESLEWYKMNNAFMMMKCASMTQERYFNSRLYESLRGNFASVMSFTQRGQRNSQYGSMWICNVELQENKKIAKTDNIPDGWIKGRNRWNDTITNCENCGKSTNSRLARWCNECRPKFSEIYKIKNVKQLKRKSSFSDEEKMRALEENDWNIRKALFSLGLNDSGPHYKKMNALIQNTPVSPLATNQ